MLRKLAIWKILPVILSCLFSTAGLVYATDYYVDSTVTDTNVASATPDFTTYNPTTFATGTGSSNVYKTVADVNTKSFSAGDKIYFRRGQTWRETLTVPSSGSAGNVITFGAYGTGALPIITGYNNTTGFSDQGSNRWLVGSITTAPMICVINGSIGTKKTSSAAVTSAGDWFWDSDYLWVYATSNPDGLVERGTRDFCIFLNSKDYIVMENLSLTGANGSGSWYGAIYSYNSHHVTCTGIEITGSGYAGAMFYDTKDSSWTGGVIQDTVSHGIYGVATADAKMDNVVVDGLSATRIGEDGVRFGVASQIGTYWADDIVVRNCTISYARGAGIYTIQCIRPVIHHNNISNGGGEYGVSETYGIGIQSCRDGYYYNNTINGILNNSNHPSCSGLQIYGDNGSISGPSYNCNIHNNIIRSCTTTTPVSIAQNTANGVYNCSFYNNLIYWNTPTLAHFQHTDFSTTGITFYNNVVFGNTVDLIWLTNSPGITIKNNILYQYGEFTCIKASTVTAGVTHTNNLYLREGASSAVVVTYNGNSYTNANVVANFEATAMASDPKFIDSGNANFKLQSSSPCIGAGVWVGLTTDYEGKAIYNEPKGIPIGAYRSWDTGSHALPGN
jgi:hypothetical protein